MKRTGWRLAAAVLAVAIALSAWRTARAAAALASASSAGERTGTGVEVRRPLRVPGGESGAPFARMAAPGRALVFVYAPDCGPCNAGMWSWTELVGAARGGPVRLHAVAPGDAPGARGYWRGLARWVDVAVSDTTTVHRALGVGSTPATLLVEDGVARHELLGPLTPAGRRRVEAFIEGSER